MSRASLQEFRAALWPSPPAAAEFAAACSHVGALEVSKWLEILIETVSDPRYTERLRVFAYVAERTLDPALFVPYVRCLGTHEPHLRGLLVTLIPKVNSVPGHYELCRMLGAQDPSSRALAVQLLQIVAGKQAFDMLVELVKDASFAGRIDAIDLMMPRALHQGGRLLAAVIASGRPNERAHALRVLMSKHFVAHPALALEVASAALDDADERVLREAMNVVATYSSEAEFAAKTDPLLGSNDPQKQKVVVEQLARFPSLRTIQILTRKLRERNSIIQLAVVEAAERIGTDAVLPILVEGLTDAQLPVKTAALHAVARLSDSGRVDAARAVLWLLRSRDVNVRRIAVEVLNRVGDPRGDLAPRLLKFLRDEDWWVRERTMDALVAMMPGATLAGHLVSYLADKSPVVRRFAVGTFRRIAQPSTLVALVGVAQSDPDWWVREEAVLAIAAITDPGVTTYLVELGRAQPDLRLVCVDALKKRTATDALDFVVDCLQDEDADVRVAALVALGELGGRAHAHMLEVLLDDSSPLVQRTARELLSRWNVQAEPTIRTKIGVDRLLAAVVEGDADDLLLFAGRVPYVKRRGVVEPLHGWKPLSNETLSAMLDALLSPAQREAFRAGGDVDLSHEMRALGARFRVNLFNHLGGVGAVFRVVKNDALLIVLENLGLPESVSRLAHLKDGLVLIGGPTGSGKSTTLAALVDRINRTQARHIVTIEDPIETVHIGERSLVTQREIGSHTRSFPDALRAALRQDPDVIVVGEMRDAATFQFAVSAAETGHLVLGTMHTSSAETSITRIINSFSGAQHAQVRAMLAASIRAIVCQALLRRKSGEGRVIAAEVMLNTDAIANLIRKGKEFQIATTIAMNRAMGMQLLDHELARLVRDNLVDAEEAHARAVDKTQFTATLMGGADAPGKSGSIRAVPPDARRSVIPEPRRSVIPEPSPSGKSLPPSPGLPTSVAPPRR